MYFFAGVAHVQLCTSYDATENALLQIRTTLSEPCVSINAVQWALARPDILSQSQQRYHWAS